MEKKMENEMDTGEIYGLKDFNSRYHYWRGSFIYYTDPLW